MDNQIKYFFKNITGTVFAKPKHYVWQLQPSDRIYRVQIQKQHKGRNKTFNKEKIYYAFVAPDSFIDDNGYATKNIFSQNFDSKKEAENYLIEKYKELKKLEKEIQ